MLGTLSVYEPCQARRIFQKTTYRVMGDSETLHEQTLFATAPARAVVHPNSCHGCSFDISKQTRYSKSRRFLALYCGRCQVVLRGLFYFY